MTYSSWDACALTRSRTVETQRDFGSCTPYLWHSDLTEPIRLQAKLPTMSSNLKAHIGPPYVDVDSYAEPTALAIDINLRWPPPNIVILSTYWCEKHTYLLCCRLDRYVTYKDHIENIKTKFESRNNIHKKLASTKWCVQSAT